MVKKNPVHYRVSVCVLEIAAGSSDIVLAWFLQSMEHLCISKGREFKAVEREKGKMWKRNGTKFANTSLQGWPKTWLATSKMWLNFALFLWGFPQISIPSDWSIQTWCSLGSSVCPLEWQIITPLSSLSLNIQKKFWVAERGNWTTFPFCAQADITNQPQICLSPKQKIQGDGVDM